MSIFYLKEEARKTFWIQNWLMIKMYSHYTGFDILFIYLFILFLFAPA